MSRMRTFIAVEMPDVVRSRLASLQEILGRIGADVKWVEAENLHVTLLERLGISMDRFGNSTGRLSL